MEGLAGADEATSVVLLLLLLWYFLTFFLVIYGHAVADDWPRLGRVLGWTAVLSGTGEFLVISVPWIISLTRRERILTSVEELVGIFCLCLILLTPTVGGWRILARSSNQLRKRRHPEAKAVRRG